MCCFNNSRSTWNPKPDRGDCLKSSHLSFQTAGQPVKHTTLLRVYFCAGISSGGTCAVTEGCFCAGTDGRTWVIRQLQNPHLFRGLQKHLLVQSTGTTVARIMTTPAITAFFPPHSRITRGANAANPTMPFCHNWFESG